MKQSLIAFCVMEYVNDQPESDEPSEALETAGSITPLYSIILIVSLIVVWLFQVGVVPGETVLAGGKMSVLFAGFVKQLFVEGQFWRVLTGATIHGGVIHLGFNSYALFVLGKLIERLSNRSHLAIVFVCSAISGGILSLIFLPESPSIGASGGVIGFLGYLTSYGFKRRKLLTNEFLKNMLFNIGFIAVIGIFVMPNIDNFSHLGGLLFGLVYGFFQVPGDLYKDPRDVGKKTRVLGYSAIGLFLLTTLLSILLLTQVISFSYGIL